MAFQFVEPGGGYQIQGWMSFFGFPKEQRDFVQKNLVFLTYMASWA